jgi:hypothetical protein
VNIGRTLFSQVMDLLPWRRFHTCVRRYSGDYRVQTFPCLEQFLSMAFAQLTYRESLRDIEASLLAAGSKLYHMGFSGPVARSTLADANDTRDWRIYADFAQVLIRIARGLYAGEDLGLDLDSMVYALDATAIDLCLTLCPWARYKSTRGGIKLHTLLNLRGSIPEFIHISDGIMHDSHVLDLLIPIPGAFYIMDRGYIDFLRLHALHLAGAFFVVRARANFSFRRRYSHPCSPEQGIRCDQTVLTTGHAAARAYPQPLRRIVCRADQQDQTLVFLTNNFQLPAPTIAKLYKARWQVETFFKWIKQHLRIKAFYGTSENAVKTQIWIAISVYLLVAILKKRLALPQSLYTILQVLSVTALEKKPISEAFAPWPHPSDDSAQPNDLPLFKI